MVNLVSRQFENLKEAKRRIQKEEWRDKEKERERNWAHILKEEETIKNWMKRNVEATTELIIPYPSLWVGCSMCVGAFGSRQLSLVQSEANRIVQDHLAGNDLVRTQAGLCLFLSLRLPLKISVFQVGHKPLHTRKISRTPPLSPGLSSYPHILIGWLFIPTSGIIWCMLPVSENKKPPMSCQKITCSFWVTQRTINELPCPERTTQAGKLRDVQVLL